MKITQILLLVAGFTIIGIYSYSKIIPPVNFILLTIVAGVVYFLLNRLHVRLNANYSILIPLVFVFACTYFSKHFYKDDFEIGSSYFVEIYFVVLTGFFGLILNECVELAAKWRIRKEARRTR